MDGPAHGEAESLAVKLRTVEAFMRRAAGRTGLRIAYLVIDPNAGSGASFSIGVGGDAVAGAVLNAAMQDSRAYRAWRLVRLRDWLKDWVLRGFAAVLGRRVHQHVRGKRRQHGE